MQATSHQAVPNWRSRGSRNNGSSVKEYNKVHILILVSAHKGRLIVYTGPRQSLGDMVNQPFATSNPASRDGADYVQSQTSTEQRARSHLDDAGHGRRMRSSSSEHSNNSWQTTSESRGELRMSSAHFNSPTAVELERVKDHRKSARGMRKLKSVVKGWVKL